MHWFTALKGLALVAAGGVCAIVGVFADAILPQLPGSFALTAGAIIAAGVAYTVRSEDAVG